MDPEELYPLCPRRGGSYEEGLQGEDHPLRPLGRSINDYETNGNG